MRLKLLLKLQLLTAQLACDSTRILMFDWDKKLLVYCFNWPKRSNYVTRKEPVAKEPVYLNDFTSSRSVKSFHYKRFIQTTCFKFTDILLLCIRWTTFYRDCRCVPSCPG